MNLFLVKENKDGRMELKDLLLLIYCENRCCQTIGKYSVEALTPKNLF